MQGALVVDVVVVKTLMDGQPVQEESWLDDVQGALVAAAAAAAAGSYPPPTPPRAPPSQVVDRTSFQKKVWWDLLLELEVPD